MKNMRYIGTDYGKESFVIFEVEIEDSPNAYFWVYLPHDGRSGKVKIETVSRFYSYLNHYVSPFYVKEEGVDGIVEEALQVIEETPNDEMAEMLKEFNGLIKNMKNGEKWDEIERETLEEIEKARDGKGYWPAVDG